MMTGRRHNWKKLIIKDPRLRLIRKNLRTILKLSLSAKIQSLIKIKSLYTKKHPNLTPSQQKRRRVISILLRELLNTYYVSILNCSMGSGCVTSVRRREPRSITSLDVDMVWNPIDENWICVDCYNDYFGTKSKRDAYQKFLDREKAIDQRITNKINKIRYQITHKHKIK